MCAKRVSICLIYAVAILLSSSAANAMSRPCTWLTVDEATAAAGAKANPGEDRKTLSGTFNGCIFHTTNISRFVLIEAYERASAADAQKFFDQLTKNAARLPGVYGQTHSNPITAA